MEYGSGMSLRGKKNQEEERMKLIIDNANIDEIRSMYEFFPMDGVTCNPTILAKEKEEELRTVFSEEFIRRAQ